MLTIKSKKKVKPSDGLYGATIVSVMVTEKKSDGPWKDATPQLEMKYRMDDGNEIVDWMPLKGYRRNGDDFVIGNDGNRMENIHATDMCTARISDMLACAGIPEGHDAHIGELSGRKIHIYICYTDNGKYYVKYHRKYEQ